MVSLKKSFATVAFFSTFISFNAMAATDTSNIAELETTLPAAEGPLTADQTQPITMPKTTAAPNKNATNLSPSAAGTNSAG